MKPRAKIWKMTNYGPWAVSYSWLTESQYSYRATWAEALEAAVYRVNLRRRYNKGA